MIIIEQMLRKKLDLYEEGVLNRNYLRGIWNFYVGYSLALAYLKEEDELLMRKCWIWRKFMKNPESPNSKRFKELQNYIHSDYGVVMRALEMIQANKELGGEVFGDTYKKFTIAIYGYQYPEEVY
jgi:hypothetical protein